MLRAINKKPLRKAFSLFILLALSITLCIPSYAGMTASEETTNLTLKVGSSELTISKGDSALTTKLDAAPVIKDSRTFLPIRAVVEALGGIVTWDAAAKKVEITQGSKLIELWIGNPAAKVNGQGSLIDPDNLVVVPFISNEGRTMIPVRFVSENMGAKVSFDQGSQTITIIYTPEFTAPTPTVEPTPTPTVAPTLAPTATTIPTPTITPTAGSGPSGDVLKFSAAYINNNPTYNNHIWRISNDAYTFQEGDYIEYDVYLDSSIGGLGGIEVYAGGSFRSSTAAYADQDGLSGKPSTDITSKAYKKWYHRKMAVPADRIGKTASDFDLGIDFSALTGVKTDAAVFYVAYYDNYVVTNKGVEQKVIYKDGTPSANSKKSTGDNLCFSVTVEPVALNTVTLSTSEPTPAPTATATPTPTITPVAGSGPSGDVLKFSAAYINNNPTYNNHIWRISNDAYTFQEGDYIEYDVYLDSNIGGLGGIEVYAGGSFRSSTAAYADQNGLSGKPSTDITSKAYKKWYHRKIAVPTDRIGKTASDFDLGIDFSALTGVKTDAAVYYVAYYDNFVVTNNGIEKEVVYKDGAPSANSKKSTGDNLCFSVTVEPVALNTVTTQIQK